MTSVVSLLATAFYRSLNCTFYMECICRIGPLEAMLKGRSLVKVGRLEEGVVLLSYAKDEFLQKITGKKSDPPELYLFIDDCYLLMMSATFSYDLCHNISLTEERQRFLERYDVENRIRRIGTPVGQIKLD